MFNPVRKYRTFASARAFITKYYTIMICGAHTATATAATTTPTPTPTHKK